MTTLSKSLLAFAVVGGLAGIIAFFNVSPFRTAIEQFVGSPVGTTFNTAKVAAINMTPSAITATSSSILNGDASDRIVTDGFATCSGLNASAGQAQTGIANLIISAGTTTTAAPANLGSASTYAVNMTIATTVPADAYSATTTYTVPAARRWAAGTYMSFSFNATNTAACNVGVHYLGS